MKHLLYLFIAIFLSSLSSCMKYEPIEKEDFDSIPLNEGLFIVNEGNFMYGNASLSFYVPSQKRVLNEVFIKTNRVNLGDVAQSMKIHNGLGYIVVNNSGVIFIIDTNTFKRIDYISGLTSPRYIHFVNDEKAYVTDLYLPQVTIIDPKALKITGKIDTKGHKSTEQMVQYGKYVFTNCWSYDNKILVIDTEKDEVVDEIEVGIQPTSLALDKYNKIWTVTDGGYEGSPYGYEAPALYKIDAETRQIEEEFLFSKGEHPSEVSLNGTRDTLYFLNKAVWRMDVTSKSLPQEPFLPYKGTIYYGLTIDPKSSEGYVADAIDYVQHGIVYRFSPEAIPVDTFRVGIIPGAFCFK